MSIFVVITKYKIIFVLNFKFNWSLIAYFQTSDVDIIIFFQRKRLIFDAN
jgi:hypothetical protein